jgi:hypothetical protein
MLARAREADVVGAADPVVTIGIFAALTAVAFAAFLAGLTLGRELAHAVFVANILGAGIAVAAIFRTVTARQDRSAAARPARAGLAAFRHAAASFARCRYVAHELRAAAARRGLQGDRDQDRGYES